MAASISTTSASSSPPCLAASPSSCPFFWCLCMRHITWSHGSNDSISARTLGENTGFADKSLVSFVSYSWCPSTPSFLSCRSTTIATTSTSKSSETATMPLPFRASSPCFVPTYSPTCTPRKIISGSLLRKIGCRRWTGFSVAAAQAGRRHQKWRQEM